MIEPKISAKQERVTIVTNLETGALTIFSKNGEFLAKNDFVTFYTVDDIINVASQMFMDGCSFAAKEQLASRVIELLGNLPQK